jgi:hypothetical protein
MSEKPHSGGGEGWFPFKAILDSLNPAELGAGVMGGSGDAKHKKAPSGPSKSKLPTTPTTHH